jgi:hypothetical protein
VNREEAEAASTGLRAALAAPAGPLPGCRCGHFEEEHFQGTEEGDYYDSPCWHGATFGPDGWDEDEKSNALAEAANRPDGPTKWAAIVEIVNWPVVQTTDGDCGCNIYRPVR